MPESTATARQNLRFVESEAPIREPVTKFGGQPVWLDAPAWPLSASQGRPMRFLGQILVEGGKLVGLAVHLELALRDAVTVAADDAAPVGVAVVPARWRVKADDDVLHLAFLVGREETHDLPAVVAHFENDATRAVQDVLLRLLAVLRHSEVHDLE